MANAIHMMIKQHGCSSEVAGIGIGSPGPLNLRTGSLALLPNFPGWNGYPLRARLAAKTGFPVTLDCDANAAALAEWKLGAGRERGVDSMAMITLGTGVGSGLILNGQIWHGLVGMGGEVDHISIDPSGLSCTCGGRGCLEMYASANGVIRLTREFADGAACSSRLTKLVNQQSGFTPLEVAELARAGDDGAQKIFLQFGRYLGLGLAGLANTLDLPLIVIGGGLAAAWPLFAETMFGTLREYSVVYRLGEPTQLETMEENRTYICPASLGDSAGLIGAAMLPSLATVNRTSLAAEVL